MKLKQVQQLIIICVVVLLAILIIQLITSKSSDELVIENRTDLLPESEKNNHTQELSIYGRTDLLSKGDPLRGPQPLEVVPGKHNTFYASGSKTYNSYGYAIGSFQFIDPGFYSGGKVMNGTKLKSVSEIAQLVKNDLQHLGFSVESANVNSPVYAGEQLIAVRTGVVNGREDYHFMLKEPGSNSWKHKPGQTAILTSKSGPNTMTWYPEYYNPNSGAWGIGTGGYSSSIIYLKFYEKKPFTP